MSRINYYPKNFHANGYGWQRGASAASAVRGFLSGERGEASGSSEPLIGNGSLYPTLPSEDDTIFSTGGARLYPALPAEEYESGAVAEVVEESCAAVNVNMVVSVSLLYLLQKLSYIIFNLILARFFFLILL